jgi:aspartate aminotransferase-like enzyme
MNPYDEIPTENNGPFKEYSVIYTSKALNLMSPPFQQVMRDLNSILKDVYKAHKVAIIPGSGTFGMEAVARQFATDQDVLVVRNGWFSFRWTEIFEMGKIPRSQTIMKAQLATEYQYEPHSVDNVLTRIHEEKPAVVFAPHVETSTGMIISNEYIQKLATAVHDVGGLFVLDCIASGTVWVNMQDLGVDVLISAPQKGWSGPACCGIVLLSEAATAKMNETNESSFALSLKKWCGIMDKYEEGAFAYHTTMPTDALRDFHNVAVEMTKIGFASLCEAQIDLGHKARAAFKKRNLVSVAADGCEAPGVLVFYTPCELTSADMVQRFKSSGLQIAAGVPWKIDEPDNIQTFRIGLFGLDKLNNVDETVRILEEALDQVLVEGKSSL